MGEEMEYRTVFSGAMDNTWLMYLLISAQDHQITHVVVCLPL